MNIRFTKDKDTKNTVRFAEQGTSVVGTLYVQKSAIASIDGFDGENLTVSLSATASA